MVRGVGCDHWSAAEFARTLGSMTKGKRKRKRPGGGSTQVAASPEAALAELDARIGDIRASDPADAGPLWGAVHKLLLKAKADPAEVAHIIATRDADALARLVRILRGEELEQASGIEDSAEVEADYSDIAPDLLKEAMRAFRKRIKLIRLDHESKLGVGPMTGGRIADFDAILPPQEFSRRVWEALVAAGKLDRAGQGFYMLPASEKAPDLPR